MSFPSHARKAESPASSLQKATKMRHRPTTDDVRSDRRTALPRQLTAAALLGGVAHLAMFLGAGLAPTEANDACSLVSSTYTCTGNQSGGIWIDGPETVLNVNNLSGDIVTSGAAGIGFNSAGEITANINTNGHTIRANGATGNGITLWGYGDDKAISLDEVGDIISAHGTGVWIDGFSDIESHTTGNISAAADAIQAHSAYSGSVIVEHDGNLTSTGGYGVRADGQGSVDVDVDGNVLSYLDGIRATSAGEDSDAIVTVEFNGNITSSQGYGIYANSSFQSTEVTSTGTINAKKDGIFVFSGSDNSGASATLEQHGNVTSTNGEGIHVESSFHAASATITGDISGKTNGIVVIASGSASDSTASVDVTGDVSSTDGYGIYARSADHKASVKVEGDINSGLDGVRVIATGSDDDATATIESKGDVTSTGGNGLYASADYQDAWVESTGDIESKFDAIYVTSNGNNGDATATSTGDLISHFGSGIVVDAAYGAASVTNRGKITALVDGISAVASSSATANIDSVGDITATNGYGLYAESANGAAKVESHGVVTAGADGIHVLATGGPSDTTSTAEVVSVGNITSTGAAGIYAKSANHLAKVTSSGDIHASGNGITVLSTGTAAGAFAIVDQTGDITSTNGYGILATATNRKASVTLHGDITSKLDGIHATSTGNSNDAVVIVDATGDITSSQGYGVYATATNMGVETTTVGDIYGRHGGIYATSTGSDASAEVTIMSTGDVSSEDGAGIYGYASNQAVTITQNGDVTGGDYGIHAVAASSDVTFGEDGVLSDAVTAAVYLEGNTGSDLFNYGEIDGGDSYAIKTKGYGGTAIENHGIISGDISIADAYSTVSNMTDGTLNLTDVTFTHGGLVQNAGTMSAGGVGTVATASITGGNYEQTEDGVLVVDLDGTNVDLVNVNGTADLDGTVAINFVTISDLASYTVLTSTGIDDNGITLERDGILATYVTSESGLRIVDGTDLVVDLVVDFAPTSLGEQHAGLGQALEDAYENDDHNLDLLLGQLANLQTKEEYEAALDQLAPEVQVNDTTAFSALAGQFTSKLFSCRVQDGAYRFTAEGECQWVSVSHSRTVTDATDASSGLTSDQTNIAAGGQWAVGEDLRFGVAAGYTSSMSIDDGGATADGQSGEVGAVLKYAKDGVILGAALTTGWGSTDTERFVNIGLIDQTITGSADSGYVVARLSAGYELEMGDTYLKPLVNLDLKQVYFGGMTEAGGSAALEIADGSVFNAILTPSLELGGEVALSQNVVARPFVRVGGTFSTGNDLSVDANFVGEDTTFKLTSSADDMAATLSAGVDIINSDNATVRLIYDGTFGETTRTDSFGFKLSGKIF
jgi:uncharacterized protein with beta-barrel porin domain